VRPHLCAHRQSHKSDKTGNHCTICQVRMLKQGIKFTIATNSQCGAVQDNCCYKRRNNCLKILTKVGSRTTSWELQVLLVTISVLRLWKSCRSPVVESTQFSWNLWQWLISCNPVRWTPMTSVWCAILSISRILLILYTSKNMQLLQHSNQPKHQKNMQTLRDINQPKYRKNMQILGDSNEPQHQKNMQIVRESNQRFV